MDSGHYFPPPSPSQLPASHVKFHLPYFSPAEVEYLSEKQRGKLSANQEKLRQQACGFIEAVGVKIGFPRKTIATAQSLYHRFHLFFPRKDFNYYDVTMACLYVSTKMHDTLKKPRDILMVSYTVRYPELAARSKAIGGEVEMDPVAVEQDRQHLLGIERLVLETICFNFTVRMPFPYVIKISRSLGASKKLTKLAWRLAVDSSRTLAPLQYPPHVVALACIYLAALLSSFEQPAPIDIAPDEHSDHELAKTLGHRGDWESTYKACVEDLEEICHHLLDLLIYAAQNPSATTSPTTPSSPSPQTYASPRTPHSSHALHAPHQAVPPVPYKHDTLMRLKIHLRETEHPARPRTDAEDSEGGAESPDDVFGKGGDAAGLGKNEGTVRFIFGPKRLVGAV
ncbi:cyclin-like protein [Phellopilus nigrolimitatus]|nr:cyclin-like protein [Phellopilus nigrolimitatus]